MVSHDERLAAALADRYGLERPLGQGGMATVHLALDLKHRRRVAVKVLRPDLAVALGAERFLREIEIAAALHHPHILGVYDSGELAGILYYVMPYVEGESLRDRLRREKQLPIEEALEIAREVADALGYAHSRGVIHRDIKPENILLQSGHALVADFGIARAVTAADALTQPGTPVGTPAYMSPEQAAGERELDGRSDQYALACVLYEMLGGQPPFTGATLESVLHQHLAVAAPPVTALRPATPQPVADALARALAKAPADRFHPIARFAEALAAAPGPAPATPAGAPPPAQLTTFIGRERETAAVEELLVGTRLLTLTGAGGSGKTRLALEVAGRVAARFPDGVAWVEFAPLLNPELVPHHVADALGVHRDNIRSAGDALVETLRQREALLVLDNCEHLVEACARLAEALLRGCPRLRILATSREALGIGGERAWLVPPLTLPDPGKPVTRERAAASEAIQLFVERTQAVRPAFDLTDANAAAVAHICQRLDGLPLAIELAAARARVLDPEQIAARLDDVFGLLSSGSRTALPRHKTLRGAIDWSHALLSEREQILFRRLAVFAGGFTIEAAEVAAAGDAQGEIGPADVLDLLSGLVDKSLVMLETEAQEARYRLLETVRQFARERLEAAGEAAEFGRRHAEYFLARAETAEPYAAGGGMDAAWVQRLEEDLGNLRAAADWFERDPNGIEGALRLAGALHWFWFARGHLREGRRRLRAALERSRDATRARARALASLGNYAFMQGETEGMRPLFEESVAILRRSGDDPRGLSFALTGLGLALTLEGDFQGSAAAHEEAVALARAADPRFHTPYALYWLGRGAQARGDFAAARAAFEEAVAIGRDCAYPPAVAHPGTARGRLALAEGDRDGALGWFAIAIPALQQTGHHWGAIMIAEDLARMAADEGDAERAARLVGAVAGMREESGADPLPPDREAMEQVAERARAALGAEVFARAFAAGRALTLAQFLEFAQTIVGEAPPARPVAGPGGAAVLHVDALGPLEISADGAQVPATAWGYARPRELLLYFLCHPNGRTRDQIGLAFWPDASPAQLKNNFHVTLHHLRKTLGRPDWIVFQGERYRVNPALAVEFDAAQFETELRRGREALAKTGDAAPLERALARYRGDFLEEEQAGDWHLEHRERWQRLYLEGLLALGEHRFAAERWAEALEAFRRVVARDGFHEAAHRRVMQCLARLGERSEAFRHYERLVKTLKDELEAEPEPETMALSERLRRGPAAGKV